MDKTQFMEFYRQINRDDSVVINTKGHEYKGRISIILEKDNCFLLEENRPYGATFAIMWDDIERIKLDENEIPKEYIEGLQV